MYEVLTSPITLLCLGIVFLLISLLFFYFKRSISLLERAQMEQARVLQSFITNMEMSRHQHMPPQQMTPSSHGNIGGSDGNTGIVHESTDNLIDVSDDNDDDSDDSDDSDDNETTNNENVSSLSNNGLSMLEIDELDDEIKVIQLQDNSLEEIKDETLEVNEFSTMGQDNHHHMKINMENGSDSDSDSDSDSESVNEGNNDINIPDVNGIILDNGQIQSIKKIPSVQEMMTSNESINESISTDLKSLTLQKLRQIAVEKGVIQVGSKINKKELIKLIEESSK